MEKQYMLVGRYAITWINTVSVGIVTQWLLQTSVTKEEEEGREEEEEEDEEEEEEEEEEEVEEEKRKGKKRKEKKRKEKKRKEEEEEKKKKQKKKKKNGNCVCFHSIIFKVFFQKINEKSFKKELKMTTHAHTF